MKVIGIKVFRNIEIKFPFISNFEIVLLFKKSTSMSSVCFFHTICRQKSINQQKKMNQICWMNPTMADKQEQIGNTRSGRQAVKTAQNLKQGQTNLGATGVCGVDFEQKDFFVIEIHFKLIAWFS